MAGQIVLISMQSCISIRSEPIHLIGTLLDNSRRFDLASFEVLKSFAALIMLAVASIPDALQKTYIADER
jgi:hypothetical protein